MKNLKYISRKRTKIASLFLMLHLLFAPILASTPHINCGDECNIFLGGMNDSDSSDNQMNDETHSCCSAAQEENNNQTQNNNCDLILHAINCDMTTEFNVVEITTVAFKFDPKISLTQVAFLDEAEESYSSELVYSSGEVKLNGPPIYITKSSFLN
ncbi:MAG: hypothetical protein GXO87_05755 [Chlorobi bacterium]|nr:hypothetical protein [Chlorobiota bacterium]